MLIFVLRYLEILFSTVSSTLLRWVFSRLLSILYPTIFQASCKLSFWAKPCRGVLSQGRRFLSIPRLSSPRDRIAESFSAGPLPVNYSARDRYPRRSASLACLLDVSYFTRDDHRSMISGKVSTDEDHGRNDNGRYGLAVKGRRGRAAALRQLHWYSVLCTCAVLIDKTSFHYRLPPLCRYMRFFWSYRPDRRP